MKINNNDNTPIYEQIYKQFLEYISTGLMQSEDKLPSVRELSSSMHINPNTVVKAYRLFVSFYMDFIRQNNFQFLRPTPL